MSALGRSWRLLRVAYQLGLAYWFGRRFLYWSLDLRYRMLVPLLQLATTRAERGSALRFFLRWTVLTERVVPPRLLRSWRGDMTLRLAGLTFVVTPESGEVYTLRELYQDRVYERVPGFVPAAGWTVLDVGANVGMFALQQAQRGAHVVAFEPNPECYRRLSLAIDANTLPGRIRPSRVALGRAAGRGVLAVPAGTTTLGVVPGEMSEWSPVVDADVGSTGITVEVTTLDVVLPTLNLAVGPATGTGRIDLLKIDVEGAETAVLDGARAALGLVDRVVVEYHSPALRSHVTTLLAAYGLPLVLDVAATFGGEAGVLYAARPDLAPGPGTSPRIHPTQG